MRDELKSIQNYIHTIEKKLALGDATEHTHRSALETMVESLAEGITATNEPKHIECGAPDFILRKGSVTVGYIEAKDIGKGQQGMWNNYVAEKLLYLLMADDVVEEVIR